MSVVMKFGGTSVADPDAINRLIAIVRQQQAKTKSAPLVVVSALSGVTDNLVAIAQLAEEGFKERNVAEEKLILESLGAGGDNHSLAGTERGQQIGQGFAGAGTRFNDEMAALRECSLNSFGHFKLAGAVFEGEWGISEDSTGREKLVESGESAS